MESKEEENNHANEQSIQPNNPIDVIGSSIDNSYSEEWRSIFNFDLNDLWWGIKHVENKVWSGSSISLVDGWHDIWFWMDVYY